MKSVTLAIITSLFLFHFTFAKTDYMKGSKPAEVRIDEDKSADRSKLIVTKPKAKPAAVKTKPFVRNDKYVVAFESSIGGESEVKLAKPVEEKSTVVQQEVKTPYGTTYVPVEVKHNSQQYYRPMRGKSTYRIITKQQD